MMQSFCVCNVSCDHSGWCANSNDDCRSDSYHLWAWCNGWRNPCGLSGLDISTDNITNEAGDSVVNSDCDWCWWGSRNTLAERSIVGCDLAFSTAAEVAVLTMIRRSHRISRRIEVRVRTETRHWVMTSCNTSLRKSRLSLVFLGCPNATSNNTTVVDHLLARTAAIKRIDRVQFTRLVALLATLGRRSVGVRK